MPEGPQRRKLLTVTFVGGGFSGVEGFGELLSLATALLKRYPELHLIGRHTDLPVDERGFLVVRPDLRVEGVADAWAQHPRDAFVAAGRTATGAARPGQPANGLASMAQVRPAAGKVPEIR